MLTQARSTSAKNCNSFAGYCDAILSSSTEPIQKTDAHLGHLAIAICLR